MVFSEGKKVGGFNEESNACNLLSFCFMTLNGTFVSDCFVPLLIICLSCQSDAWLLFTAVQTVENFVALAVQHECARHKTDWFEEESDIQAIVKQM
jgi:hypothetical protein